jgi:cell division protein FtsL
MNEIKKYIGLIMLAAIVVEAFFLKQSLNKERQMENDWKTAQANVKAYDELLSDSKQKNIAFQLTTDQLTNAKDSVIKELEETRKQLKIKSKNVKSEQHIVSSFSRVDTIQLKGDTIFKDRELAVDTVIGDNWYNAKVSMKYPSTVIINPSFKSEKNIIVSTKRETVNPPKKLWILRLFQKKHTVLKVDVVEKNPYVSNEESRYVEIVK